ncbi:MAG: hypothetical protein FWB85_04275 [Chitinispirillia bacterium]|nr:hypothetical protein [Chitinispirillia bacterium]
MAALLKKFIFLLIFPRVLPILISPLLQKPAKKYIEKYFIFLLIFSCHAIIIPPKKILKNRVFGPKNAVFYQKNIFYFPIDLATESFYTEK